MSNNEQWLIILAFWGTVFLFWGVLMGPMERAYWRWSDRRAARRNLLDQELERMHKVRDEIRERDRAEREAIREQERVSRLMR